MEEKFPVPKKPDQTRINSFDEVKTQWEQAQNVEEQLKALENARHLRANLQSFLENELGTTINSDEVDWGTEKQAWEMMLKEVLAMIAAWEIELENYK